MTVPIVSRLYDPRDFGIYALISSLAVLVTALVSLGLQSAIVRAETEEESQQILAVALVVAGILTTGALAASLALSSFFQANPFDYSYERICVLTWLLSILTSTDSSLRSYANRRGADKVLFYNSFIGAVATILVTVPLGLLGVGATGLVAGSVVALVISNIQITSQLRLSHRWPTLAGSRAVFRKNNNFVVFQYPANLVEAVSEQAPRQVLASTLGAAVVGSYAMSDRMLGIAIRLVGAPVGIVYFREASRRSAAGHDLNRFTLRILIAVMLAAYLPTAMVVLWGDSLFAWFLGEDWVEAGKLASLLVVPFLFKLMRATVGTARVVLGLQSVNLLMSLIRLVVEVGALAVGSLSTKDVVGALAGYAAASTTFYVVDLMVTLRAMGRSHWLFLAGVAAYLTSLAIIWVLVSTM